MKEDKDRDVLYITLIDFLLQLIFLAIVIGTVYMVTNNEFNYEPETNDPKKILDNIKKTSGVSDITELTDFHTRLGPIKEALDKLNKYNEIENEINQIGGVDKVKQILQMRLQKGQGSPSCLDDETPIVLLHAYKDRIEIKENTERFSKHVLSKLGLTLDEVKKLDLPTFTEKFKGLKDSRLPNGNPCKYNVAVCEYSDSVKPRDRIREIFWIKTIKNCSG